MCDKNVGPQLRLVVGAESDIGGWLSPVEESVITDALDSFQRFHGTVLYCHQYCSGLIRANAWSFLFIGFCRDRLSCTSVQATW